MLTSATQPLLCRRPLLRRRHDPEQQGSAPIVPTSTRTHDFLMLTGTSHVRLADNSTLTHLHLFLRPAPSPLLCPMVVPPIRPIQQHTSPPLRPTWRPLLLLFFLASTGPFNSVIHSPAGHPGSQRAAPTQVDRTSLRDNFCIGPSCSCSPSSGPLCSNALTSHLHFRGSTSVRLLICGGMSGINKDTLKVHLTHLILYDLMLTLFTYISRSAKKKKRPERLE